MYEFIIDLFWSKRLIKFENTLKSFCPQNLNESELKVLLVIIKKKVKLRQFLILL